MTLISIRERSGGPNDSNASVSFDGQGEYPITIRPPFAPENEEQLEWYFEQRLRVPFTDHVKARAAADSIVAYGEALFNQVFAERQAFADYKDAIQAGVASMMLEIAGSPEFHQWHWEALKDPDLPRAFALDAPMVRKNLSTQVLKATVRPSPTINMLVVTARPNGDRDVGYRTISRPLVEALRQTHLPVQIDIVRPGTYQELVQRLEAARDTLKGSGEPGGYYHVVHFDVHGAVLPYQRVQQGIEANRYTYQARFGRADLQPYEGHKAFLFLEGAQDGQADPVAASWPTY